MTKPAPKPINAAAVFGMIISIGTLVFWLLVLTLGAALINFLDATVGQTADNMWAVVLALVVTVPSVIFFALFKKISWCTREEVTQTRRQHVLQLGLATAASIVPIYWIGSIKMFAVPLLACGLLVIVAKVAELQPK